MPSGALQRDPGRLEEAEALGAEAVRGARRSLHEGHWITGVFLGAHGKTLAKLERYTAAEEALLEAHEILEATLSPEHERSIKMIGFLVDLYEAWHTAEPDNGHDARAAEWRAVLAGSEGPKDQGVEGEEPAT